MRQENFHTLAGRFLCGLLLAWVVTVPAEAQSRYENRDARCCPTRTETGRTSHQITQEFPSAGPAETAWRVRWAHATGKGLFITGAWFRKSASAPFMRILWDARVSDIFVPYHRGYPRFLDLSQFSFDLVPVSQADAGCCGFLLDDFVVGEIRDRGVLWKDDEEVRRGEELVLWATVDSANYNYIIEYSFRDDGSIGFRLGATATNYPPLPREAHMHSGLWRIDIDLNGFPRDSATLGRHQETTASAAANDSASPFNGGVEGSAEWNDLEFTTLRVSDQATTNAHGENVSYDLMPYRWGTPRHVEPWARADFWVTRYRGSDLAYTSLPTYADGESVTDTDVVLWHVSPVHHLPRREDFDETGVRNGVALVMWGGFQLRPRNLFDGTPLHP